jgi:hypothetical protein
MGRVPRLEAAEVKPAHVQACTLENLLRYAARRAAQIGPHRQAESPHSAHAGRFDSSKAPGDLGGRQPASVHSAPRRGQKTMQTSRDRTNVLTTRSIDRESAFTIISNYKNTRGLLSGLCK